jgi:hypothetical protein
MPQRSQILTNARPKGALPQGISAPRPFQPIRPGRCRGCRKNPLTRVGVGASYHHFRSKDEILLAANEKFQEPVRSMIRTAEATPDPAQALSGFIAEYLGYWTSHPKEMTFILLSLTKLLSYPELRPPSLECSNTLSWIENSLRGRSHGTSNNSSSMN